MKQEVGKTFCSAQQWILPLQLKPLRAFLCIFYIVCNYAMYAYASPRVYVLYSTFIKAWHTITVVSYERLYRQHVHVGHIQPL